MIITKEYILKRISIDSNGCWLWQRSIQTHGYAYIQIRSKEEREQGTQLGHRLSYMAFKGDIPDGLGLDHLCKVKHCVNPDHLEPVPQYINNRRRDIAAGKDMSKFPCGHSRVGEHVYRKRCGVRKNGNIIYLNVCRPCYLAYAKRYNKKYKEARRAATNRIH